MTNVIASYWRGQQSLAKAYWMVHFFISMVIGTLTLIFLMTFNHLGFNPESIDILRASVHAIAFPYTVFSAICVWRCANNTKRKFWKILARILVCFAILAGILGVVTVLLTFFAPQAI